MARHVRLLVAVTCLALAAPVGGRAQGGSSSDDTAVLENCRERFFVGAGDEDVVRSLVPPQYELVRNASGAPLIRVAGQRCERYSVDGTTRSTTASFFAAFIESPDGKGCESNTPVVGEVKGDALPLCNNYILFWALDNPDVVRWGRRAVPGLPVSYVKDLSFVESDSGSPGSGATFRFEGEPPVPSPFVMDGIVRERPFEGPLTVVFWWDGSEGTVKLTFQTEDIAFGGADLTLRPRAGSQMAKAFGTVTPAQELGWPPLSAVHWGRGELRMEVSDGPRATPDSPPTVRDCNERAFFGPAVESELRKLVPEPYQFVRDASGRPFLSVAAIRCNQWFVDGRPIGPVQLVLFEALIQSPDGVCPTGTVCFGFYPIERAFDRAEVVPWFREGTPCVVASSVPTTSFVFDWGGFDPASVGEPFHFEAGTPVPSPFVMDGVARENRAAVPVTASWWCSGKGQTVKISLHANVAVGDFEGNVRAARGSEMARLFGTETPEPSAGFSAVGAISFEGYLTKEIFGSSPPSAASPDGDVAVESRRRVSGDQLLEAVKEPGVRTKRASARPLDGSALVREDRALPLQAARSPGGGVGPLLSIAGLIAGIGMGTGLMVRRKRGRGGR